ncbi:MAG: type IV secretion system protein [Sphingomicrobium sp.]
MIGEYCNPAATDRFASRLLADTDCQACGLIERGYAALAQPGGTVSAALTGLMVIAVAFFGYRLLLGRGIVLSDAVELTIKLGVVLLIATSWQSWQALAYDGLARAQGQVASEMLVGIGAPPPLDSLEQMLDKLTSANVGYRTRAGIASPLVGGPAAAGAVLNLSAVVLTLFTVGILVATRVVLAILLAIAPVMAGFILFDATRGIAQGWLGAMAAAALAPLFVFLIAAIEFAVMTPMIARLLAEQAAGVFENTSVMPIGLVTVVFGIAMVLALRASGRIGHGIRLAGRRALVAANDQRVAEPNATAVRQLDVAGSAPSPRVSRALEAIARRDSPPASVRISSIGAPRASSAARDSGRTVQAVNSDQPVFTPTTRMTRLRSAPRRSRAAARRDG